MTLAWATLTLMSAALALVFYWLFVDPLPIVSTELIRGPVAVHGEDGARKLGEAKAVFRPGETFGYQRRICVRTPVDVQIIRRLVHITNERVYTYATGNIPASVFGKSGCWTDTEAFPLPNDAAPGLYHLQNIATAPTNALRGDQEVWMRAVVIEVR